MAVFSYARVSTTEQTTLNQKLEIERAGFTVDYWFEDVGVSGKTSAIQRPQFSMLLEKIRDGETVLVKSIDRLGRDAIDVLSTVKHLSKRNIKVIVLQLGNTDLTSTTGKLLLTMLSAVAEMERSLIVERTQAGLARAKAEGKQLGRRSKTTDEQKVDIRSRLCAGESVSSVARAYNVSRATVVGMKCGVIQKD